MHILLFRCTFVNMTPPPTIASHYSVSERSIFKKMKKTVCFQRMFVCKTCAYAFSLVFAGVTVSFYLSFDWSLVAVWMLHVFISVLSFFS